MITVRVRSKLKTSGESVVFTNTVGKNSRYFVDIFNKAIIPLTPFANHVEGKVKSIYGCSLALEQGYQCCFADATNQG